VQNRAPSAPVLDVSALVGESTVMAELRTEISAAARTHAKVMLFGETGVGKEVVARMIHEQSARRDRAFVAVNCSGIPETLLESELFGHTKGSFTGAYRDRPGLVRQANGGTLFLDELGEMNIRMQAVLLRFTETGEVQPVGADASAGRVDVRLVTATNRDLRVQIAAGAFREDLYYRLNVIHIHIPPLRERGDDVMLLLHHYFERAAAAHGLVVPALTPDAAQLLMAYAWPGNVRELKNITERLVLMDRGKVLTPDDLPDDVHSLIGSQINMRALPAEFYPDAGPQDLLASSSESAHLHDRSPGPRATPTVPNHAELQATHTPADEAMVAQLWSRMAAGEDFWAVVYQAFKARELRRTELAAIIHRGLQETGGSYRALVKVFNLPPADYKRFHAFIYQQQCNLPVAGYRRRGSRIGVQYVA
jgi:DNA-binding NtrC family response regulator